MNTLPLSILKALHQAPVAEAWAKLAEYTLSHFQHPLEGDFWPELHRREQAVAAVDDALANSAWELWEGVADAVPSTADKLANWWEAQRGGRAVLILDALSLRELPWLIQSLDARGYTQHSLELTRAELPPDTTPFAKALGFASRAALRQGASSARLPEAKTTLSDQPWLDAADEVDASPRWLMWHSWLDDRLHKLAEQGHGLKQLSEEAGRELCGDDFWTLIERLTQGRRLLITGDHGYAAPGLFPQVKGEEATVLKARFKAQRAAAGAASASEQAWMPPLDIGLPAGAPSHRYVLGRRRWKVAGGSPTLSHGGLTLLELLVPSLELSRPGAPA